ncbi:hypothetical protein Sipo8835_40770 [Streptomyces ipomoeae]|uniref:Uncharacterized protein n=1 Tax=Streptomyces ipomoeae TaxID=103232 RepID=A0AAE8VUB8_9ACTN|nr:hypothetical protein [Streptomyces ipomoeae]TQE17972.1 hypothetical protein Sipo8835_40770 [Streptomyces ipomoeae]
MRIVRWGAALGLGALWWWGALRLALAPDAGAVEGAVVAGGWGLSLLPVHCVPKGCGLGGGQGAQGAGGRASPGVRGRVRPGSGADSGAGAGGVGAP